MIEDNYFKYIIWNLLFIENYAFFIELARSSRAFLA
jgi:hypothetical protein